MKKTLRYLLAFALVLGVGLSCFACTNKPAESQGEGESKEETVKRTEHYLYGVNYVETQMSDRLATAQVAYLARALGAESVRVPAYCMETGTTFEANSKERIHTLCQSFSFSGIDQVIIHQATLPLEGVLGNYAPYPDLEDNEYTSFLDEVENMAKLLASEFTEVAFWQIGHRMNDDVYLHPVGWQPQNSPVDGFTPEEKAQLTVDVCYRVTKGLRAADSDALVLMPDFIGYDTQDGRDYLERVYEYIASGEHGSQKVDDFFGAISFDVTFDTEPGQNFTDSVTALLQIIKDAGDEGRHAFISEVGFLADTEENQVNAEKWIEDIYNRAKAFDFIESVAYYRMFTDGAEKYGLITEPRAGFKPTVTGNRYYAMTGSKADLEKYVIKEDQYSSGDNVALNVPTTASSSCEHPGWGWSLAGINNGTLNYAGWSNYYEMGSEEWATIVTGTGAPRADYPEWVVFELPYRWEIDTVKLYARNQIDEVFHQIYGLPEWVVVEVSDDGETWKQVGELKITPQQYDETVTILTRDENPPYEITFDPVTTKYVRVYFKTLRSAWQHTENAFFVQLEEIEILMH